MNTTHRKIILFSSIVFIPLLFLALAVNYAIYTLTMDKHRAMTAVAGYRQVEKAQNQIAHNLDMVLKDLTMLAFIHESYDIYTGRITQDLEDTFMTVSYNRRLYEHIRYLNRSGKEVFRIDYNNGSPRITFPEELRFAGEEDCYLQSIGLRLDQLYISPMDLRLRSGRGKGNPILHLASPITDADGVNVGVLVIDFTSTPLLNSLAKITDGTANEIMLLNQAGDCLKGPIKNVDADSATADCGTRAFSGTHPAEWGIISAEDNGQFSTKAGLFTYATVNLSQTIRHATRLRGTHKAPQWKVIAWTPLHALDTVSTALLQKLGLVSGSFLIMAAVLIATLAVQRARRSMAEALVLRQTESNQRFVPKEFLGLLHKTGLTEVDISDNVQRTMTTMFADIRSYTKISESMTPRQVLDFLNAYYRVIDPIITRNGGFIDAFIGDAIMALFPERADGAIRSAVAIKTALRTFRHRSPDGLPIRLEAGFGLHCGEVTIGAVGTDRRMQTTAIGDAVNLTARIESSTKVYGVGVIITEKVRDMLADPESFHMRSIDRVRVKGKQDVVELFEVFNADSPDLLRSKNESRSLFEAAMRHYREGYFEIANEKFREYAKACPEDPLTYIYIKRCNTMLRVPPGDGWTGVSTL